MELVTTETAQRNLHRCLQDNLCGKCHRRLGHDKTFILELPILILRVTPQAPMHAECANQLIQHPDLAEKLVIVYTCKGYEKLWTAGRRMMLLRPSNPVEACWWINGRPAVADDVLDALSDNNLSFVLQGADQFEWATRKRICAEASVMLELIETKLLPKVR